MDFLLEERVVLQVDGYAFHSDAHQRAADIEHDARLQLEGYRAFRVDYHDVVHRWEQTSALILRAIALS